MIYLRRQLKKIYYEWGREPYLYEKDEKGCYQETTYQQFLEESFSIASFFLQKGYHISFVE